MPNEKLLSCTNLSIGYRAKTLATQLSFELSPGELLVIKGSNGSGKSTLIKTIIGDLEALSGNISWKIGLEQVAYLPQAAYSQQNFSYTVDEIIRLYDIEPWLLNEIPEVIRQKKWIELSGGERQRVLFITRIDPEKKVVILDEPFNHLDKAAVITLAKLINVSLEKGLSIILVSHQTPEALHKAHLEVNLV